MYGLQNEGGYLIWNNVEGQPALGGVSAYYWQTYTPGAADNFSQNSYHYETKEALQAALGLGIGDNRVVIDPEDDTIHSWKNTVYSVGYEQNKILPEQVLKSNPYDLYNVLRNTPKYDLNSIFVGYSPIGGGASGIYNTIRTDLPHPILDTNNYNTDNLAETDGSLQHFLGNAIQKFNTSVYSVNYTDLINVGTGSNELLVPKSGLYQYQTTRPSTNWKTDNTDTNRPPWTGRYEWSGVSGLYEWNWGGTGITSENYIIEDGDTNISGLTTNNLQKWNTSVYQINYSVINPSSITFEDFIHSDSLLTNDPQVAGIMDLTLGSPELRVLSQEQITSYPDVISQGDRSKTTPGDFRDTIISGSSLVDTQTSNIIARSLNYKTQNRANRVNAGDPGRHFTNAPENTMKNVFKYALPSWELEALDKITAAPMYESSGPDTTQAINDLVKFRIAAVLNTKDAGRKAIYMHFRAFINSFNDSYNANWATTNYVGRGNPFYNYTGFTRTIQMSFTVAAQSKAELAPMFSKLNYLASTLAPDYGNNGFMKGNIVRVTMGGYLYEVPGIINNLSYDIPPDATWEIAIGDGEAVGENEEVKPDYDTTVKELPHRIEVTMGFTPIHDFLPAKPNNWMEPEQKFISLRSAFNSGLYGQLPNYKSYPATANPDIGSSGTEEVAETS